MGTGRGRRTSPHGGVSNGGPAPPAAAEVRVLTALRPPNTAGWKGLALARAQFGLSIIMANTLKWHKVKSGELTPIRTIPPKRQAESAEAAG